MGDFFKRLVFALALVIFWPKASWAQLSQFNWQPRPMQSGEIANIVWSPSNPEILYLGVEVNSHSLYKSTDAGRSWRRVDQGDHAKDVAVHPTNPDIVFYSDSQSLWRTTSGGDRSIERAGPCDHTREKCASSFTKVIESHFQAGPTGFSTISIAPSNPQVVYVGVPRINYGPFGGDRQSGGQLHKSTDGGASFKELAGSYPGINAIAVHPSNAEEIFVAAADGIYTSSDGGKTLTQIHRARAVVDITTIDGTLILAGTEQGLLRSADAGTTWQSASGPLAAKATLRVRFAPTNKNVVWATTTEGVFRSDDAGASWQEVSGNLPAKNLQSLAVHPTNPNIALVATDTFRFSIRSDGLFRQGQYYNQGIYRTEDGGKSWSRSDQGIIEYNLEEMTAHPSRPFEVWAGQQASRGMYRSKDAGQSWSLTTDLLPHYPMRFVFFPDDPDKAMHSSLHTGQDFGITTDSGVNWQTISEQAFFKGVNRGKSLFDQSKSAGANLHIHGIALDPKNPSVLYAGSVDDPAPFNPKPLKGSHIFKSTDQGKTWIESDEGYDHDKATAIHDIKVDPTNTNNVYIATTHDEASVGNGIWKSTDAGKSWQRANQGMSDSISVVALAVHSQKSGYLLAATEQGIFRSSDDGASWKSVHSSRMEDIELDPANPDVSYAGGEGGVLMSTNFGESWQNVSGNLGQKSVSAIAVNSTGKIVYAGVVLEGVYVAVDPSVGSIPADRGKTELGKGRGFGGVPGTGPGGPGGPGGPAGFPAPPKFAPLLLIPFFLGFIALLIWSFRKHRTLFYILITAIIVLVIAGVAAGVVFNTIRKQFGSFPSGGYGGPPAGFDPSQYGGP